MSTRYTPRKYPFAYLANGQPIGHERARREMRPFFADKELSLALVLRRRGRSQYFARPPRRGPHGYGFGGKKTPFKESVHAQCLRRVKQKIEAGAPVRVRPFDGLRIHPMLELLPPSAPGVRYCVCERSLREFPSIRPDLQVRTVVGNWLLLVVEVCDSHPVGCSKASLYRTAGVPCIEIRAIHGLDSDGIFNAETMWGPGAPVAMSQALLQAELPPFTVVRRSGRLDRMEPRGRAAYSAMVPGRRLCPRPTQPAVEQGLHPIIRMFLRSVGPGRS